MKEKQSESTIISKTMILIGLLDLLTADLIQTPKDSEALIGTLTFFNCSSNLPSSTIHWFHYEIGNQEDRYIVYGYDQFHGSYQNRFHIERNDTTGESNLIIDRVSVEDAGKYECHDDMGRGASGYGQLSVLENNPFCGWKIENRQKSGSSGEQSTKNLLYLNCTVNFRGNNPPQITWKSAGEAIAQDKTKTVISAAHITHISTLEITHDINGQSFQCETNKSVTTQFSCSSGPVGIKEHTDFSSAAPVAIIPVVVVFSVGVVVVGILIVTKCIKKGRESASTKNSDQLCRLCRNKLDDQDRIDEWIRIGQPPKNISLRGNDSNE